MHRRELAGWFQTTFAFSCVRACALAQFSRAAWYRASSAKDQTALRMRIREFAHARPRFGFWRIWVLLRREGWKVNHKRVRRLYRLEGQHRYPWVRPSAGAWTSSTTRSPTGGHFGCSRWSISGVARVHC